MAKVSLPSDLPLLHSNTSSYILHEVVTCQAVLKTCLEIPMYVLRSMSSQSLIIGWLCLSYECFVTPAWARVKWALVLFQEVVYKASANSAFKST